MTAQALPTFADVEAAARRLAGHAVLTPLLRCPALDALTGATVLLKAEPLQRTGSFKFRGAYNRLSQMTAIERKGGVVAWSSGNHAQGVAAAAQMLGMPAVIVMPDDAPAIKTANTRGYGAEVIAYDRATQDREVISRAEAAKRNAVVVPSYDDPHIVAGQGTVGLEIMAQAAALGLQVDDVIVPASGGGLVAGVGLAAKAANPAVRLFTAEPAGYDDHRLSLESGARVRNATNANALCDALLAPTPGAFTWQLNGKALSAGYAPTDTAVKQAMTFAFHTIKLVVEPGGAVALAALLSGLHKAPGRTVAVVLSGGNVDAATFTACIGG